MSNLATVQGTAITAMTDKQIADVRAFEKFMLTIPQCEFVTSHVIHGGMYARTMMMPEGAVLTGALIKIPTILIVNGDATVYVGGECVRMQGHAVLPASAGRKQAFVAHADTYLTMLFPSMATTVEQAEREFTDEYEQLLSHHNDNDVVITGE